jgi:hypothetical protein
MVDKIDFFDDSKVGPAAKRLAFCFNISARMVPQDGNPLSHAEELFKTSTGLDAVPFFNSDERNYLKLKLFETAAIRDQGHVLSIDELDDSAKMLYLAAKDMNLIRDKYDWQGWQDERHISFPGS